MRPRFYKHCAASARRRRSETPFQLFVRSDQLCSRQQLLEIGTVTDWIPHWVNLQTSYGNYLARRDGKQMSKSFDRFLGSACACLDLREASLKICTREGVLLDWH